MFGDKRRPPATIAAEIDRIIGLNIRRAREDVRLGQHEVATLMGISLHVLARYEEGQERAPASTLLELTRHLGCQLTDLFSGMPSMEMDDEFPGSRPISVPHQDSLAAHAPVDGAAGEGELNPRAMPAAPDDASSVAGIIKAYSELTNPLLREHLVSLLKALA